VSDQFKALVLNQEGDNFTREVKSVDKSFLKHGDVTIKVDYSDLNFKDGMILKNGGRLVKEFPHIPGIDFSGTVLESENSKFKSGDEVILTGFRVGEIFYGGYSQIAKVNGFNEANHPSQFGMKEIGAKAVLAKRRGRFITNIRAINSICPGKTNAKHKLIDVTKRTNRISVVKTIPKPYKLGHP